MPDNLRTIMVDGLSVQTTDAGAQAIEKLNGVIAAKDKAIGDAEAAHAKEIAAKDAEIARLEAAKDAAEAKVLSDADLDKRVADRADLIGKARSMVPNLDTAGLADAAIRKAVVQARLGDQAIAGKSDAYIDARFDILAEDAGKGDPVADAISSQPVQQLGDADKAYAENLSYLQSAYRNPAQKEA